MNDLGFYQGTGEINVIVIYVTALYFVTNIIIYSNLFFFPKKHGKSIHQRIIGISVIRISLPNYYQHSMLNCCAKYSVIVVLRMVK